MEHIFFKFSKLDFAVLAEAVQSETMVQDNAKKHKTRTIAAHNCLATLGKSWFYYLMFDTIFNGL